MQACIQVGLQAYVSVWVQAFVPVSKGACKGASLQGCLPLCKCQLLKTQFLKVQG